MNISPLVRSIDTVMIDKRTGREAIIYFTCDSDSRNDHERFKDQIGCVTFVIGFYTMNEDGSFSEIENISPHAAKYKISTFLDIFGSMTISDFYSERANLMIQEIGSNSNRYWNLTIDKLQTNG